MSRTDDEAVVAGPSAEEVVKLLKAAPADVQRRAIETMFEKMADMLEERDRQLAQRSAELEEARAEAARFRRLVEHRRQTNHTGMQKAIVRAETAEARLREAVEGLRLGLKGMAHVAATYCLGIEIDDALDSEIAELRKEQKAAGKAAAAAEKSIKALLARLTQTEGED